MIPARVIGLDCEVIENGVDIELFQPAIDKPESDKIRILFSGNPSARKGKDALIVVAERLPDHCQLVISIPISPRLVHTIVFIRAARLCSSHP